MSAQNIRDEVAEIVKARTQIGESFLKGNGIEVGAGDRPFPVPPSAYVLYGDIRKSEALETYFKTTNLKRVKDIDAQTFAGVADASLDFVISAHVIEHLRDPIGSIVNAIRVLRPGGIHILSVPDMRFTFDRDRPETRVEHALRDYEDGGASTCQQAYDEHLRYVHPQLTSQHYSEAEIQSQAGESARRWREFDVHFHAWTQAGFDKLLEATKEFAAFRVEAKVFTVNENIFVLRKLAPGNA